MTGSSDSFVCVGPPCVSTVKRVSVSVRLLGISKNRTEKASSVRHFVNSLIRDSKATAVKVSTHSSLLSNRYLVYNRCPTESLEHSLTSSHHSYVRNRGAQK